MSRTIAFTVYGQPAPQGSKRPFINKHTGHAGMAESSEKKLKPWREAVKSAARDALETPGLFDSGIMDGPISVRVVFTLRRPKSHYRSGKNSHILRDDAPKYPCAHSGPDVSKLARSTEDALTDAGVWVDDGCVYEYSRLAKVYCGEDPEAMDVPGARIVVTGGSNA